MDKEHSTFNIQVRAASTALLEDTKDETEEAFRKLEGLAIPGRRFFNQSAEGMID